MPPLRAVGLSATIFFCEKGFSLQSLTQIQTTKINTMEKIKLTKIAEYFKSTESSIDKGMTIEGYISDDSLFPKEPTIGRPFVIDTYRTSSVQEILSPNTFKTHNSVYRWEKQNISND